jgi:hypothetical protein
VDVGGEFEDGVLSLDRTMEFIQSTSVGVTH